MQTEPQINQEYIQTSKVNMVFKHLIHIGPDSLTAAEASQCAGEQGKFWQYHDVLYQNQGPENSGWASKENLKNFGSQVGIDKTKFDSCLDSGKYNDFVKNSNYFAASLGLSGTPSFIIVKSDGSDPEKTEGAYPFASFKQVLDKKLAEAGA
jgi:protein-disulfide isomerase